MVIFADGWLQVPFDGHDLDKVCIAVENKDDQKPAFLDWHNGQRVAKVRAAEHAKHQSVWLVVNGTATRVQ